MNVVSTIANHWGLIMAVGATHVSQLALGAVITTMPEKLTWASLWTWFRDSARTYWNLKNPATAATPAVAS